MKSKQKQKRSKSIAHQMVVDEHFAQGEHRSNTRASSSTQRVLFHDKNTALVLEHFGKESRRQSPTETKTNRQRAMFHSSSSTPY